jgi:small subunit ribosomal protein S8
LKRGVKGIRVSLRYLKTGVPAVFKLQLCSTSGRKQFLNSYQLSAHLNLNQSDILILSTSKGLLTGVQAQLSGVGGELLCIFR